MMNKLKTIEEVQAAVKGAKRVLPRGGGSKPALSTPPEGTETIELGDLVGVEEYDPDELTFTALAGTYLTQVEKMLAAHGQYLPFDPPLVERGATLGGTVAAGLSGPGRYHYGGIRDFLLGVCFIDSQGQIVRGGGKVVKNVAGFDLPKLMIGSRGSLGVLVELTFKVFPKPQAFVTLRARFTHLEEALKAMQRVAAARLELDALDLEATPDGYTLLVRLGGFENALPTRLERLREQLDEPAILQGPDEQQLWRLVREFAWVPVGWTLVKVPLTPGRLPSLEKVLAARSILRRYMAGGQVAWIALEDPPKSLAGVLETHGLSGVVLFGPAGTPRLGELDGRAFYRRVKDVLDPAGRFVEA